MKRNINNQLNILKNYFVNIAKRSFVFLAIFIPLIYTFILTIISFFVEIGATHRKDLFINSSLLGIFFKKVIFAPFIETLFFQALIIEIVLKTNLKNKDIIAILISGLVFGGTHFFNTHNILYTIFAIIAGLLFASI